MDIKPWYKIVTPRADLRDGRPLDASEFAVHLDHVRDGRAPAVYKNPVEFFERTHLTKNLRVLAIQVAKRLNGIKLETSAIFNMSTQFGGGKTHALTALYHLARGGDVVKTWNGVAGILSDAGVSSIPVSETAIFVGTEFDSFTGRGGADGTPLRKTPWGEVAFQLGGIEGYRLVEEHEKALVAPGGDVIERILPKDRPVLILLDELMNYVSRSRKNGLSSQLYNFIHNLTEVIPSHDNVVLAVSIPASELEMNAEDQADFERLKKLLDRRGKSIIMSSETETSEIIRRRLFEWGGLPDEALKTIDEYEEWIKANKHQIPDWFPADDARKAFKDSYPFHPALLSVFERKWQGLPRFQQTRGVLRLLALWVSKAYSDGYRGAHKDPLISLGTAPLEDPLFRAAMFDQLGESRLEPAVTTDIAGKDYSHAIRLDAEATAEVKKGRLHCKVATAVLFESNGGQQRGEATLPEVRLAVAEPGLDIGNVEQCLEELADKCYFLGAERNRYRFSFQPNLNKLLSDRRANVTPAALGEKLRAEVQKVFSAGPSVERIFFPQESNQIPNRPLLTLVVLAPDVVSSDTATLKMISTMTMESGTLGRTFKSALVWCVTEEAAGLKEEARKVLAWKNIEGDAGELKLDENQLRQLAENLKRAERDLREHVWRSYKNIYLLGEDNQIRKIDLGLIHSSAAGSLVELIITRLKQEDIVTLGVSPNLLMRYWPPALPEWSTKGVRDAFFASPKFPRLANPDSVKDTIASGVERGLLAYVGRQSDGTYEPFIFRHSLTAAEIEISDDVFIISKDRAEAYLAKTATPTEPPVDLDPTKVVPPRLPEPPGDDLTKTAAPSDDCYLEGTWSGAVAPQKWMNFYTRVLSKFTATEGLNLSIDVSFDVKGKIPAAKVDEVRMAIRELGLAGEFETKK